MPRRELWPLLLVVGLYLIIGVAYSTVNPILESPDEALYYENIRYLAEERRLPVLQEGELSKGHHPPLYFALGAVLTGWLPDEHRSAIIANTNPFWAYHLWQPGVDNKSLYLHDPALEGWPYRDVALGVHLMRWLSLLMGAGVVVAVYLTARKLVPTEGWLAASAAAVVAFNPMFLYIQSSVHNDALTNPLAALAIYGVVRYWQEGPSPGRAAFLGLVCGLGILTKITFLFLGPVVLLAIVLRSWRERHSNPCWRGQLFLMIAIGGGLVLLLAGWWFLRNQLIYGDPTSMGRQAEVWGVRENAPDVRAALRELGFLRDSFWGIFGYGQIPMPRWLYGLLWALVLFAAGGLVLWAMRSWRSGGRYRTSAALLALLLVAPVTAFLATFARMTVSATANFGRYLFLSYGVLAPMLVLGITEWFPLRWRRVVATGLAGALLALSIGALAGVLAPAYAPPPIYASPDAVAIEHRLDAEYPGLARLLGYNLEPDSIQPGETAIVTLFWEVIGATNENYVEFVQFIGDDDVRVGGRDTHPGLGRYPTSRWQPGQIIADTIPVPIAADAAQNLATPLPTAMRLDLGLHADGERLLTVDGRDTISAGRVRLAPREPARPVGKPVHYALGDMAALIAVQPSAAQALPGTALPFTLTWQARQQPDADYVVFVHLLDEASQGVVQADGPPQGGRFPTGLWQPGDVVIDARRLELPADLPEGTYQAIAGWYRLDTLTRLPASDATGQPLPGDAIPLFTVEVRAVQG